LRPCVDGREVKLTDDGEEVDHLRFDFAQRREISELSKDISVLKQHKIELEENE